MMESLGVILFAAMSVGLFLGFGGIMKARTAWNKMRFFVARAAKERPVEFTLGVMALLVCTAYGGTKPPQPDIPPETKSWQHNLGVREKAIFMPLMLIHLDTSRGE
jgi:hypothetical protein